jgi:Holliday junction resolvase RusA-like endonuclease
MNGVVYKDDSQIIETFNRKRYAETPGVVVIVRELEMGVA